MALTVVEASVAYQQAMRNIPRGRPDLCGICHTFTDPSYGDTCYPCRQQPNSFSLIAPISYSEHGGQLHTALRNYKDGYGQQVRDFAWVRLTAILWRFLNDHEPCLAARAGVPAFELVTTVPSSSPDRDAVSRLRAMVAASGPIKDRYEPLLAATEPRVGREYDPARYEATRTLSGESVLVVDDTWTTGGHAQSAGSALLSAGATRLVLVVIGRHLQRSWEPVRGSGRSCGDEFDDLPVPFDWETCVAHP